MEQKVEAIGIGSVESTGPKLPPRNLESIFDDAAALPNEAEVKQLNAAIDAQHIVGDKVIDPALLAKFRKTRPMMREGQKVRRNDPCPCGSGKKFKNCCINSGKYNRLVEM